MVVVAGGGIAHLLELEMIEFEWPPLTVCMCLLKLLPLPLPPMSLLLFVWPLVYSVV